MCGLHMELRELGGMQESVKGVFILGCDRLVLRFDRSPTSIISSWFDGRSIPARVGQLGFRGVDVQGLGFRLGFVEMWWP